jgi:hypothetical protein
MHPRLHRLATATAVGTLALAVAPALVPGASVAVGADHGSAVVAAVPSALTPHVMNGSVNALVQIGSRIVAAGTFTSVSPAATYADPSDDVVRDRIFAFDATTGAIDPTFDPDLGGAANSLTTDGTYVYVGGAFTSVGGDTGLKRVVKLTAAGAVVPGFKAVPNAPVNEVVARGGRLYAGGAFTSVKSGKVTTARSALAALDPVTGAVLPGVDVAFTGVYDPATNNAGGTTNIARFDVLPDGSRLAAVGNFDTVGGLRRAQVAVLDTSGATATVAPWATTRFDRDHNDCAGVFDTFTRDVDFSPDGSFFVVSTTGAFAGGAYSGTMCDSVSRWETASTGNDPSWTAYTGGDTTYGVAVTGAAVYVGGHMRWQNNPFQGDQAGPGAVAREGVAALDPLNGLPLSWNPGRTRGVGAQALLATSTGLWVGSDTTRFANRTRGRIAYLPLAGGTTVAPTPAASLPADLFGAQRTASGSRVLYRVDAGGAPLQSADGGPDWTGDDGLVVGGNSAGWGTTVARDASVPASTPDAVFTSERWGNQDWNLPLPAGRHVTLRLLFANQYDGTAQVGQRVFDVAVDGTVVLDDFDIVRAVGNRTGTVRSFSLTADGDGLDVDLRAVVENPLVNGIEVLDDDVPPSAPTTAVLQRRPVDASGAPTAPASTADASFDWSGVRGGFVVGSTLYHGLADGTLVKRTFDAATGAVGPALPVDLRADPDDGGRIPFRVADLTGTAWDGTTHRLYYTVYGDSRLFYRGFTPESDVVGAQEFVADAGGVDFRSVAGLALASGRLLWGSSADGSLRSASFSSGRVTGSPVVVSSDGSWRYRALFSS